MSKLMISVAGIRGIVGDSIQPEQFVRFTLAFAGGCRKKFVVIGGDAPEGSVAYEDFIAEAAPAPLAEASEDEVAFWHELDEGFQGRQSLFGQAAGGES